MLGPFFCRKLISKIFWLVVLAILSLLVLNLYLSNRVRTHAFLTSTNNLHHSIDSLGNFILPPHDHSFKDHDPFLELVGPPIGKLWGPDERERAPATLLALVRNDEVEGMVQSMKDLERTFNHKFNYPWTFLNDAPFTEEFIRKTSSITNAPVSYHLISPSAWYIPPFIDVHLMHKSWNRLFTLGVQYSNLSSYHQMCRFNSGPIFLQPALKPYKYYWRVEPHVHFFCNLDYDPFHYLLDNNLTYGFVINIYDDPNSIPSLWPTVLSFLSQNPHALHRNNSLPWLTDVLNRPNHTLKANGYSTCHFWSNFEIASLDFFRSDLYQTYFNYLDRSGGFFYERWGDAPVHSIALALFEDKSKIHWFKDIGYQHVPYFNCPNRPKGECSGCEPGRFTDGQGLDEEDCRAKWFKVAGIS